METKLLEYKNTYWRNNPELFLKLVYLTKTFRSSYLRKLQMRPSKYHDIPPYEDVLSWIENSTKQISDLNTPLVTKVCWVLNGVEKTPLCQNQECRKSLATKHFNILFPVQPQYCSRYCMRHDPLTGSKISKSFLQNKEIDPLFFQKVEQKRKNGKVKRGLPPNWCNQEKALQTLKQHVVDDPEFFSKIQQKREQTNLANGHPSTWNNRQKAVKTRLKKNNGVWETSEQIQKREQTCLKKYGTKSPNQSDIVKENKRQSCLIKFGVDSYSKTEMYHTQMILCNEVRKKKEFQTKRKNNSFCSSSEEDKAYAILLTKFDSQDIVRQYRSELYPFNCDFYIKSLDLYIEANFFWHHQDHFYDEFSEEDRNLVSKWKSKNKKIYDIAIKVWTCSDLKKVNTAIRNKLHYLVFWNITELENWVNVG